MVEMLEPQGLGALQLAFEQLKKKLAAEGLFAPAAQAPAAALSAAHRHRHLAARRRHPDLVQILSRRFPGLHIRLFPALVQGEGAVEEVCRAID